MALLTDRLQELINQCYQHWPTTRPNQQKLETTKVVAHRGAWGPERPENTLASFQACINKGVWAVEFDIRWTKDNEPIIHHDASLARVWGQDLAVDQVSFKNLRQQFPGIPHLSELIEALGKDLHLFVELKTMPTRDQALVLKRHLEKLSPQKNYHLMSLELDFFDRLLEFPNESFVSIGRMNLPVVYRESLRRKLGAVTGHYCLMSKGMIAECHSRKMAVGTGFPHHPHLLYREAERGVDWIFSNHALELARVIKPNNTNQK